MALYIQVSELSMILSTTLQSAEAFIVIVLLMGKEVERHYRKSFAEAIKNVGLISNKNIYTSLIATWRLFKSWKKQPFTSLKALLTSLLLPL